MSIFLKKKEFLYNDVKSIIPKDARKIPLKDKKSKIEYRWRFIEYRGGRSVEISRLINNQREYKDKKGDWVHRNISRKFDNYVKESYYYYINN